MFNHPSALSALAPYGDPTPEALHREAYYNESHSTEAVVETAARDHRAASKARLLRAQVAARVGQFFSAA